MSKLADVTLVCLFGITNDITMHGDAYVLSYQDLSFKKIMQT